MVLGVMTPLEMLECGLANCGFGVAMAGWRCGAEY